MINQKYFYDFILALDERRFYDAHEIFEELWFPKRFESSNEVKLLKSFINAAVSFELYKKGREQQSKKVWTNYLKYRPLLFKLPPDLLQVYYKISRHIELTEKIYIYQKKQYNSI